MPAMLERNGKDGKPTPSNIPPQEVIHCSRDGCKTSYTLSYTDDEYYMHGSELNVDKMRRLATEIADNEHPAHFTQNYLWKGPERGWLEADSLAARAAL
jgi:hypothetical protein